MLMPMEKDNSDDVAFEFVCPECNIAFYEKVEESDFQDSEDGSSRKCPACRKSAEEKK